MWLENVVHETTFGSGFRGGRGRGGGGSVAVLEVVVVVATDSLAMAVLATMVGASDEYQQLSSLISRQDPAVLTQERQRFISVILKPFSTSSSHPPNPTYVSLTS